MTAPAVTSFQHRSWLTIAPFAAVIAAGVASAPLAGGIVKVGYILACVAAGWWAWRRDPAAHLAGCLALIAFTPLVRRLLDNVAGYDPLGLILVGPLLAMMPAALLALYNALPLRLDRFVFHIAVGVAVLWATLLTMVKGEWVSAATGAVKWGLPLAYGMALQLYVQAAPEGERILRRDRLIAAATAAFAVLLPVIGAYGIWQYVDPPSWDRLWLRMAPITSAGTPEPFGVRTFATLSGPAVCASFIATGLFLVLTLHRGRLAWLALIPAAVALLLTMYRTAWVAMVVAVMVTTLSSATRWRAVGMLVTLLVTSIGVLLSPLGEQIIARLQTFGDLRDASAMERLGQIWDLWSLPHGGTVGMGFSSVDVGVAGAAAVDGMIIAAWFSMGIVFGMLCIAGLIGAIARAVIIGRAENSAVGIALAALAVAQLVQMPLASIASGELGILFWIFTSLACPVSHARPEGAP